MYKIINEDKLLGIVDSPRYVRLRNGVFVQCPKEQADGVAFNSQFYRFSYKDIDGYDPVDVVLVDGGEYIVSHEKGIADLNEGLTEAQMALCENYETSIAASDEITSLQLALAEVYEMQLGTE